MSLQYSWRKLYLWSTIMKTLASLSQLILIFQVSLSKIPYACWRHWPTKINTVYMHINNIFFSLGDDVVIAYINGILFLPVSRLLIPWFFSSTFLLKLCILSMKLCPKGAEGTSYSLLTTFSNVAGICGQNIAMLMAEIWFPHSPPPSSPALGMSPTIISAKGMLKDYGNFNLLRPWSP